MLHGDRRRQELAYSLLFGLPGTPMLRYGDEIGMGDDLSLPERDQAYDKSRQWWFTRNRNWLALASLGIAGAAWLVSDRLLRSRDTNSRARHRDGIAPKRKRKPRPEKVLDAD